MKWIQRIVGREWTEYDEPERVIKGKHIEPCWVRLIDDKDPSEDKWVRGFVVVPEDALPIRWCELDLMR